MLMLLAATALAQEARTYGTVSGEVVSVDQAAKTAVVKQQDGTEATVRLVGNRLFRTWVGSLDDLVEGQPAEVNGRVTEEKDRVTASSIIFYTAHGRGGNQIYTNLRRADGTLAKSGDNWIVKTKDGDVEIVFTSRSRVSVRAPMTIEEIKPGASFSFYGRTDTTPLQPSFFLVSEKSE